jgi:hypothetical protein
MKSKLVFVLLTMVICFGFTSCKDDDPEDQPCSVLWFTELQNEISAISAAGQAWGTNPTVANCIAYKAAYQDYLDALAPYGDCATLTGQDRTSWQEALTEAQQSVNEFTCTEE